MSAPHTSRRAALGASVAMLLGGSRLALAAAAAANPDADLIRLCAEHVHNFNTYNTESGSDDDNDPLWIKYRATLDAISEAEPQTMAGVVAKSRAAMVEAGAGKPHEDWESTTGGLWAADVVYDLVRVYGGSAA